MSKILIPAVPQYLPSPPHSNTPSAHETLEMSEEAALTCKQNQKISSGLSEDIWRIILKKCWQDGARNLGSLSLVCTAFYRWSDEVKTVKNWQIDQFLNSAQAKALFTEKSLKALQSTFQLMRKALQIGEILQATLYKKAFQKAVKELTLKQENLLVVQLSQKFLSKEIKRGVVPKAIEIISTRSLFEYKEGDLERYKIKLALTQGDLVEMGLCTLKEFKEPTKEEISLFGRAARELSDETVLAKKVTEEIALYILTRADPIFSQDQKPNIRKVLGLFPDPLWNGVIKTYENYGLREVEDLLASRVEAIVGTETAHWAISNGKRDLFIALLKNGFNLDTLNAAGESLFDSAMQYDRFKMIDDLLKYGADVSHLLKADSGIAPIRWAIARNREKFLEKLLALVADQNVLNNALAYARENPDVNAGVLKLVFDRIANLKVEARHLGEQMPSSYFFRTDPQIA